MRRSGSGGTTLALAMCVLTGCAGGSGGAPTAAVGPTSEEIAAFEATYRARTDSARMRYTPADVHFVTGMIAHHTQALIMARLAPTNDAGASLGILAARVINAQQDEIALMEQWLRDRNQPLPEIVVDGIRMSVSGPDGGHAMPGMLTPEQMDDLAAARGEEFDRRFLTYMIQHHQGAVTMVHELFATDGAAQDEAVFKLASDIQVDQITEIDRMKRMLDEMGSARAPTPNPVATTAGRTP